MNFKVQRTFRDLRKMEIQFQKKQQKGLSSSKKKPNFKATSTNTCKTKFVGVRQRPSGKWVAEIKDTTQKIRMWLGTFDTAEEAARAYDEAACLLRGSNTRTNFTTHVPSANSALSSKIRNILHQKLSLRQNFQNSPLVSPTSTPKAASDTSSTAYSRSITSISTITNSSCNNDSASSPSSSIKPDVQMFDGAYRPDLSSCIGSLTADTSGIDYSWAFSGLNQFPVVQAVELPKEGPYNGMAEAEFSEFERMTVERQISASLFAMNGVNDFLGNTYYSAEAIWDLPILSQLFCPTS